MLLKYDMDSSLQVVLITPQSEFVSVSHLIIMVLFVSLRTGSCTIPVAGGEKSTGIEICLSIYHYKLFILQKP